MTAMEFLEQKARERDRSELELSDAFDVKASIVLLILTFLGTISATILTAERVTAIPKLAQILVVALLVISGLFCVLSLWPKDYLFDDLPKVYADWFANLPEPERQDPESLTSLSLDLANGRIARNHALNGTKAWYLNRSFWTMTLALFVEMAAVALIAFTSRPF